MKVLAIIGVLFLTGCGSFTSLEDLEHQAMLTGDWSAVEERERVIARRKERAGIQCPSGYVSYCQRNVGSNDCQCIDNDVMRDVLASF